MIRGTSIEHIASYNKSPLSVITRKDNKAVSLPSTFCGELPKSRVDRFNRKQKRRDKMLCPFVIDNSYNRHMGGIDLLDSLIGRCKIQFRWYMRLFFHFVDTNAVLNSWLLNKRVQETKNNKTIILNLLNGGSRFVQFSMKTKTQNWLLKSIREPKFKKQDHKLIAHKQTLEQTISVIGQ